MSLPTALDGNQRNQLDGLVRSARRLLEEDLADQAEGRFGLHSDGRIEELEALHLDPSATHNRAELVEIVDHLRTLGESSAGAVLRLIRETAFTHLNRLVAIRVAESAGLVPESLARGDQSDGFRQLVEVAALISDGYWVYLQLVGDELAADTPALFDPRNPLLELVPTPRCVEKLVTLFADPAAADLWEAADTLGWAYQFFNTGEERRAMRESGAPRDSRELAVRNQFFTPRYVVDFLVQNTLGRRLIEADPASPILDELPLLIDPPTVPGPALDLGDVKILDPACGSGHFLLGCYDLLERAWALHGVDPVDAAPRIVASLWGVEIDPRCTQIASAAIMLRARRHCRDLPLPQPNVVCARPLPIADGETANLDIDLRRLVEAMTATLEQAPKLGVLLKAEEELDAQLNGMIFGDTPGALTVADHVYEEFEGRLLSALEQIADRTTSTVADRLFAAEAGDALRLIDICRTRFDVVLMNPPFGEPVPETKPYLRDAYPWMPTKDANLLAAFVGRGLQLCKPDGYLGAITSRAGLFLTTFTDWRTEVLLGNRLTVLADIGYKVMEQALVEAAAYVIGPDLPTADQAATFIRVLKDADRPAALSAAVANTRAGRTDHRIFRVPLGDFGVVPRSPVAYWMSPSLRRLFTDLPPLEATSAYVRQGLATGDDFRFVRAFWEVNPRRIARSRDETRQDMRWCPFAKGGEYSPFWADIHLVVDWENDGERIRSYDGARPQNTQHFFRPGLTWPRRTASGFSPRILPAGCVFADKGPAVIPWGVDQGTIAVWLNSRVAQVLLSAMLAAADEMTMENTSKSYEVGHVQRLPWPGGSLDGDAAVTLRTRAQEITAARARVDRFDETSRRFLRPAALEATSVKAAAESVFEMG